MSVRICRRQFSLPVFLCIFPVLILLATPTSAESPVHTIFQAKREALEELRVEDIFGRRLNNREIILVDWEGHIANPLIKIFITPPANTTFPGTATLTANGTRLYFDLPSTVGAAGPSKSVFFPDASPQPIYLSIFPDRDAVDETYTLSIDFADSSTQQTSLLVDIRVIDQDKETTGALQITVDFSQDQTGLFADPRSGRLSSRQPRIGSTFSMICSWIGWTLEVSRLSFGTPAGLTPGIGLPTPRPIRATCTMPMAIKTSSYVRVVSPLCTPFRPALAIRCR